jgi:hypothetical protein
VGLLGLTGCTSSGPPSPEVVKTQEQQDRAVILTGDAATQRQVIGGSAAEASVGMSRLLFQQSPVAVIFARQAEAGAEAGYTGADADLGPAASAAVGLQVPLLVLGPGTSGLAEVSEELDRLGVVTVVGYGDPTVDWAGVASSRELVAGPVAAAEFLSVLDLPVTAKVAQEADVVTSVSALESEELQLLTVAETPETPGTPGPVATDAMSADAETDPPSPAGSETRSSVPSSDAGSDPGLPEQATTTVVPGFQPPERSSSALVLATASSAPAAVATARAAGAEVQVLAEADPRSTPAAVEAVHAHADSSVYAVGDHFGSDAEFAAHARVAATGVELPGGGQTVFPGRRMVALYGHPSGPYLGALGEQDIDATVARVKELAGRYQPFSDEPVIPALDLIATVASADPGPDGDYSSETPIEDLEPWVDAAEEAGVYVVLDFQSGRTDFLSQVRLYEQLLVRPSVGLALDPEWRLAPGQVPLQQIGTVSAGEINSTSAWLADLTRERDLPQKLLMVHQFRLDMISEREDLDVSHRELAVTLHADGHGTPGQKLDTWAVLQNDMPEGIWPSWKNFYDEDQPTLTPEQTYLLVDPKPWLVTYQ